MIPTVNAPDKCLCCGAEYSGGSVWKGEPMKEGLRVFYKCGASLSYKRLNDFQVQILFYGCCCDKCEAQD